jgi:hypothetical protein
MKFKSFFYNASKWAKWTNYEPNLIAFIPVSIITTTLYVFEKSFTNNEKTNLIGQDGEEFFINHFNDC